MYGCESWTIKKAECQRIDAFALWCWRRLLRVPLDCKEIKPVNPKGNQSWIFIGRTDAEAEPLILWPPNLKSWLFGKDPDAGKDWGQEEKETTENEMVGWRHWLNGQSLSKLWEIVKDREAWRAAAHGVAKSRTGLSDWTAATAATCDPAVPLLGTYRKELKAGDLRDICAPLFYQHYSQ